MSATNTRWNGWGIAHLKCWICITSSLTITRARRFKRFSTNRGIFRGGKVVGGMYTYGECCPNWESMPDSDAQTPAPEGPPQV